LPAIGPAKAGPYAAGFIVFAVLATANGAGYRYGVSDQAFHIPAAMHALNPELMPRDAGVLDAQARLMLIDDMFAGLMSATGLPLDVLFFAAYLLTLGTVYAGILLIGTRVYRSYWTTAALVAALTLRHQISGTSANSLEPYFNPRVLAFGLGLLAVAAFLRRRLALAVVLVAAGALVHVTTALWFAIMLGTAILVSDDGFGALTARFGRRRLVGAAVAVAYLGLPLLLAPMSDEWLRALATKDTLFASQWPVWVWAANLGMAGLLWAALLRRQARGAATPADAALASGALVLAAVFLLTLPLLVMRLDLIVQLQISRVFWLIEAVALVFLIGLADLPGASRRLPAIVAGVFIALSAGRGAYIMLVERPERALVEIGLADTPWHDAMRWLRGQPIDTHVLADPGHAWKYGTSVRVSGERDVFLEDVKDAALAIYSSDVAARVVERAAAIGDFGALTAEQALALAATYDLDVLVTEREMALPTAYRNRQFAIYNLNGGRLKAAPTLEE
jgi:hypothetical protein